MESKLNLFLIKPSKYDDDGYVIRYWKGVLPSNTLACLYGLSEDVRVREVLGADLKWNIETIDETVQKVDIPKIVKSSKQRGARTVVCLVGVQSNQFPRAADLALDFRRAGLDVLIGGFHVSGVLSTLSELPQDMLALKDAGVTIVAGEVEGRWEGILRDALNGSLKPIYNFLEEAPSLSDAPTPQIPLNLRNRYAVHHFATLDCGRGCPFQCSFCTVINVQGRSMRFRCVDDIVERIRENYARHKISFYFFTDDNFCRNRNWESLFDALIELRENENIPVTFMMQVDTQSYKLAHFVEKASRAGCSQVFIGMESINEENLKAAGKNQNRVEHYKSLIDAYRDAAIATHLAYIIGFPFDSEESVLDDMKRLQGLGADQASFFMLTPLPGSMDYRHSIARSVIMDADLNNFDTFHETFRHSRMGSGAWTRAYETAWKTFYGLENMKNILRRAKPHKYWDLFLNFLWYKNAVQVEGGHPMLHGFVRLKCRRERRKTFSLEGRWVYFTRRVKDLWHTFLGLMKLALELEEVWLSTRHRNSLEERVLFELGRYQKKMLEWRNLRLPELRALYRKAALQLERSSYPKFSPDLRIRIPNHFQLWFKRWNVFSDSLTFTRFPMEVFWATAWRRFKRGRLHEINILEIVFTSFREFILFSRFFLAVTRRVAFSSVN